MIRVIDRTLAASRHTGPERNCSGSLPRCSFPPERIFLEVTADTYGALGSAAPNAQYILRVQDPEEAKAYSSCRDIKRFVCANRSDMANRVYAEIRLNDMRDFFTIVRYRDCGRVRILGLADAILQPVDTVLNNLRAAFSGTIELSPENDCIAATSLALEWAISGGTDVVTLVLGHGQHGGV
jgi:homocitrate synthase NifV